MHIPRFVPAIAVLLFALQLAGCGGGGDAAPVVVPPPIQPPPGALQGQFVDGPVDGISYSAIPSGLSGTTSGGGYYSFQTGDTVTFTLNTVGSPPIVLGTKAHPGQASGVITFVTSLQGGQQVAEILHALNHGAGDTLNVSGLTIPPTVAVAINNYISSDGTNLGAYASDDEFLRYVQVNTTTPVPFAVTVQGSGTTFLIDTVLPHLQASAVTLSSGSVNPNSGGTTSRYSGSVRTAGTAVYPAQLGCSAITATGTGGAILNATVSGNLQVPGIYTAAVSSGSFSSTATASSATCTVGDQTFVVPGTTESATSAPSSGNVTITSDGRNLSVTGPFIGPPPAGCTGGTVFTGEVIGLSNPMLVLSSTLNCDLGGLTLTEAITIKMVGAF